MSVLLALITVAVQEQALGLSSVIGEQLRRHDAVLAGTAPDPWEYRLLAEWVVSAALWTTRHLRVPAPVAVAFLGVRLLQNVAIFLLAAAYYRRLGLPAMLGAVGLVFLGWSMTHALHNSDLSVNTYFDVIAYLLAGLCATTGRSWALVPLAGVAALNRDTAGLIPFFAVASLVGPLTSEPRKGISLRFAMENRRAILHATSALATFVAVYVAIRVVRGPAPWPWGYATGADILWKNLRATSTYLYVGLTVSVLPLLAVWNWRRLPALLRGLLLVMVPTWLMVHLLSAYVAETRVLLVPMAVILIPSALFFSTESTS